MSVGHVTRALESSGIPTVVVMVKAFEHHAREAQFARTVITKHPMGRPLGAPGDAERQAEIIKAALGLLETAPGAGTVLELSSIYRPTP